MLTACPFWWQVPRGWDKLSVSISSHDTGKTIVKSGKTSVKNGICRWTETFRESVSISQEKGGAKELQGCLFRFAVAMVWFHLVKLIINFCIYRLLISWWIYEITCSTLQGSSRSGILGEVTVNLAEYASSKTSVPLSLLLNKCNYGTSLQVRNLHTDNSSPLLNAPSMFLFILLRTFMLVCHPFPDFKKHWVWYVIKVIPLTHITSTFSINEQFNHSTISL